MTKRRCWSPLGLGLIGLLSAGHAGAIDIQIDFQAQIDDIDDPSSIAQVGDFVVGTIIVNTDTAQDPNNVGNYPFAATFIDIGIIPDQGPFAGTFLPQDFPAFGDVFVGTDSFEIDYFVDIFSGNFQFSLQQGPAFNNSLVTAGNELLLATQNSVTNDALDAFTDPFNNSSFGIQTDDTFGNAFALFDYVEVTELPALVPGDADGDGDVDDTDLGIAISNFTGPIGAAGGKTLADGDTDGDGDVDDTDLGVAISGFTGPLSPAAVPEPASLVLITLGGLLATRRRRG